MHILLIGTWDIKCGISLYTENIYREIKALGHEVTVLAEEADERNRRYEVSEEGVIRCWRRGESWQHLLELVRGFSNVDVVNIQHEMSYCWQPHLWQQLIYGLHTYGLPVVATYHTIPFAPHPLIGNTEMDGIIVCNPKAKEAMIRRGWPAERIWRVQHGMFEGCPPPMREPTGRLAVYGFLSGSKGYSDTMDAMQELLPKHSGLRLTIFGALSEFIKDRQEGYYYDELRREITVRHLQDRVAVLMGFPHQDMLHQLLADHDILVLYYKTGSSGYCESGALHTGLVATRPIIVSKAHHFDCSPEMGPIMLQASSKTELVNLIDRLLSDPEFYQQRCQTIYDFVRSRPLSKAAQEYVTCFEAVINNTTLQRRSPATGPLLGAVVLSQGRTNMLDRALQSIAETAPDIPIVVVDNVGAADTVRLMHSKWQRAMYLCLSRSMAQDALRMGVLALSAQYAKVLTEEDVLLPGWYAQHQPLCQRQSSIISCAGIVYPCVNGSPIVDKEVQISAQLCVSQELISSLYPLPETDAMKSIPQWLEDMRRGGHCISHISSSCFLRDSQEQRQTENNTSVPQKA